MNSPILRRRTPLLLLTRSGPVLIGKVGERGARIMALVGARESISRRGHGRSEAIQGPVAITRAGKFDPGVGLDVFLISETSGWLHGRAGVDPGPPPHVNRGRYR